MSQAEGTIQPGTGSSAPPPSVPVTPPPSSAPVSTPAPAVEPAAPASSVAPATPSAPAPPSAPTRIEDVLEKYHTDRAAAVIEDPVEPVVASPEEPAAPTQEPVTVGPPEPSLEAPAEITEPVEPAQAGKAGDPWTSEADLQAAFPRGISKEAKAEILARETDRAARMENERVMGGEPGVELAKGLNALIYKPNPTPEDADALLDLIVLPEHGGAKKMFDVLGNRMTQVMLYDDTPVVDAKTKQPVLDSKGKPLTVGADYVNNMIKGEWQERPNGKPYDLNFLNDAITKHKEWGKREDGSDYDFEFIDKLVRAEKAGIIKMEFVDEELADQAPVKTEPTAKELELQQQLAETRKQLEARSTEDKAKAETQRQEAETKTGQYRTMAKAFVSRTVMSAVMDDLTGLNWTVAKDDKSEDAETKKWWGGIVSKVINAELMGSPDAMSPAYKAVMDAIEDYTAFDMAGKMTPRFRVLLEPLVSGAKAQMAQFKRHAGKRMKFAASTTRDALLAKKNGHGADTVVPPVATPTAKQPNAPQQPKSVEDVLAEYHKSVAAARVS